MNSLYLILGAFLFLIIAFPSANTTIAQTYDDCKMNVVDKSSKTPCQKVCDECAKTQSKDLCDQCATCDNGAPPFGPSSSG